MLEAIRSFFSSAMSPGPESGEEATRHDLRLAACALLLELAHADDEFTEDEQAHVDSAVRRHFGLDQAEAARLLELAAQARREAVDLWQFTSLIAEHYSLGQKMVLAEIMWGLVYSDGDLAGKESYLMRKISSLLRLEPGYLAEARQRVGRGEGGPPTADAFD
ncbi:MAG: TerB family tellurite resistance protein [Gemmatimonadota bacterium]|nr:TerB family tellurite resistance protein [Gemmatimonadota bacterium]